MQIEGVHIETLHNPAIYTTAQLEQVCEIAHELRRGKLVLTLPPEHDCDEILGPGQCPLCEWLHDQA